MDTITLLYRATTLPALTDRNGEVIGNWVDNSGSGGNQVVSVSADHAHGGSKCYKIVASGAGDFTTNWVKLPSANNATFVVGTQYALTFWGWSGANTFIQIKTGGVTSSAIQVSNGGWGANQFVFTASSATTDLLIIVTSAATVYLDDLTVTQARTLNILSRRGLDDPDSIEMFPPIQNKYLDGTVDEQFQKFRRKMVVQTHVVSAKADRIGLLYWHLDTARMINYWTGATTDSLAEAQIPVALQNPDGYESTWFDNFVLARAFTLAFQATTVTDTWPVT